MADFDEVLKVQREINENQSNVEIASHFPYIQNLCPQNSLSQRTHSRTRSLLTLSSFTLVIIVAMIVSNVPSAVELTIVTVVRTEAGEMNKK